MLAIALAVAGAPAPRVTAESIAAILVLGIVGSGVRVRAELPDHHQRGSDGRIDSNLPAASSCDRARRPGLGESITVTTLAGIALVLVGVALTRRQVKLASSERQLE